MNLAKSSNVVLVRATVLITHGAYSGSFGEDILPESLSIGSLVAYLEAAGDNWNLCAINPVLENLSLLDVVERTIAHDPLLVGVSVTHQWQYPWMKEFTQKIRERIDTFIVVGGVFSSSAWQRILNEVSQVDGVCRYQGEETLLELLRYLRDGKEWRGIRGLAFRNEIGKPVSTKRRPSIKDLTILPHPKRSQSTRLMEGHGLIQIESSRGCNAHCTFCDMRSTGWIGKSAGRFVDELEELANSYPGRPISIIDSTFIGFGNKRFERARDIAQEILTRKLYVSFNFMERPENIDYRTFELLKRAGLVAVFVGTESFSNSALKRWRKGCDAETNKKAIKVLTDLEIQHTIGLLVFDDMTVMQEIQENVEGLREICQENKYIFINNFSELIPYSGTYLERQYQLRVGNKLDKPATEQLPSSLWTFGDPRVGNICYWAAEYLAQMWPLNRQMLATFHDRNFTEQYPVITPTKNRLFIDFLEALLASANKCKDALGQLCHDYIGMTREELLSALDNWSNERTRSDIAEVINNLGRYEENSSDCDVTAWFVSDKARS